MPDELENQVEPTSTEEPKKTEPELDLRTKQALDLFSALEDPETAPIIIKTMAERLGLLSQDTTKKEAKETISTVKQVLKMKLGDDGFITPEKLGEALEEIFNQTEAKFQQQLVEIEKRRAEVEFQKEYTQAIEELEISEEEAGALTELVNDYPWNGKTPVKKYLSNLVAMHRATKDKPERKVANFKQRGKTSSADANESMINDLGSRKFATPREAIEYALKNLNK